MKRYQVIRAETIRGLMEFVNNEMKHGWKVTGGLVGVVEPSTEMLGPERVVYLQAMIHERGEEIM